MPFLVNKKLAMKEVSGGGGGSPVLGPEVPLKEAEMN